MLTDILLWPLPSRNLSVCGCHATSGAGTVWLFSGFGLFSQGLYMLALGQVDGELRSDVDSGGTGQDGSRVLRGLRSG